MKDKLEEDAYFLWDFQLPKPLKMSMRHLGSRKAHKRKSFIS